MNTLHTVEANQKIKTAPDIQIIEYASPITLPDMEKIPDTEEVDSRIHEPIRERIAQGFEHAMPSMSSLAEQLAPGIKNGTWSTVLGDDSKGRLPALVIGRLADRWSRENNRPRPARKFIAGGRRLTIGAEGINHAEAEMRRQANLDEYVSHLKPELGKRVLLVTEYIGSGHGMKALLSALKSAGIPFDLATVDSWDSAEETKEQLRGQYPELLEGAKIYIGKGEAYRGGSSFTYDKHGLVTATGVSRTELSPIARVDIIRGDSVKAARNGVHKMVTNFYRQYFQSDDRRVIS